MKVAGSFGFRVRMIKPLKKGSNNSESGSAQLVKYKKSDYSWTRKRNIRMLIMKCDEENQKSSVAEQRFVLLNKKKEWRS